MKNRILGYITFVMVLLPMESAFAALSPQNNNFRIFEDSMWLVAFTLMIVVALLMRKLSWGLGRHGYMMLAVTGVSGWCWKFIGLIKRVFVQKEPQWFFTITRESFEGATGVLLAIAFLMLAYSIMSVSVRDR